ncbi:MAG: cation:proton antiporter [Candidatus Bathycorpusculaceae bacterium]
MEDVLLLIVISYGVSLVFGYILEKYLRMPWMFASLFFGLALSATGMFRNTIESDVFKLLQSLGMYFLLFIIGFNLDFRKMDKLKKYVVLGAITIIIFEGLFGSLVLYFIFPIEVSNSYFVALITSLSFATVGEAILLPILAEFKIIGTTFGQLTLGIGTLDDVIEVLMLAAVAVLPGFIPMEQVQMVPNPLSILFGLACLLLLTLVLIKFGRSIRKILENNHLPSFVFALLTVFLCFSFIALGSYVYESLAAVGAIFGGMVLRGLLPKERLYQNERAVEFLGYVFLSPIFFLSVGASVSLETILVSPLMIAVLLLVANTSKYLASFLFFRRLLGVKYALLLGVGLGIRFSTSLIVQFILLKSGLITLTLYSALVATAIVLKPIVIGVYSWALSKEKPP